MRTFADFSGGISTVNAQGPYGSPAPPALILRQNPKTITDISAFSALDLEFRIFGIVQTNRTSTEFSTLLLETSMQNDDQTDALWTVVGEPYELPPTGESGALGSTISTSLLRYLRWRIVVPARGTIISEALTLQMVFQFTGFGRS